MGGICDGGMDMGGASIGAGGTGLTVGKGMGWLTIGAGGAGGGCVGVCCIC